MASGGTATINVLYDTEDNSIATTGNKNITLDLQGHTITRYKEGYFIAVQSNGTFTSKDTVGGGKVIYD